jgi:uncharacterized repeat protein (TIGR03837 family)
VRLWVDDLTAFRCLRPEIDPSLDTQQLFGVEVRRWTDPLPDVKPGDVVIEALACDLPETFIAQMARTSPKPVWLNLEYLTAEPWAEGVHGLPSPHPRLPLTKYFYMPGYTPRTGGLTRESWLAQTRDAFQADSRAQAAFWQHLGLPPRQAGEMRISLFAYENAAIASLLTTLARSNFPTRLLVPEGKALAPIAAWLGLTTLQAGEVHAHRHLTVHVLPMLDQDGYDRLLWACDVNFVRGEDSFLRAQFAARPLVWQAYPQEGRTHFAKLDAFLDLYCAAMPDDLAATTRRLWHAWNEESGVGALWPAFVADLEALDEHARLWSSRLLEQQDLASKLMIFCAKVKEKARIVGFPETPAGHPR